MSQLFCVVNGFSDNAFGGNPAGVVLLERIDQSLDQLRDIVATLGLPEVSFIAPGDDAGTYHIRWVTPEAELDVCGHGSVAAAHVVATELDSQRQSVHLKGFSGRNLTVGWDSDGYTLTLPRLRSEACSDLAQVESAVGASVCSVYRGRSYLAFLSGEDDVASVSPDFQALKELDLPGVIVAAPGEADDFVCRYFAPRKGIPEDHATGTANIAVADVLREASGQTHFTSRQLSPRGGAFAIAITDEERCQLTGNAHTLVSGVVRL